VYRLSTYVLDLLGGGGGGGGQPMGSFFYHSYICRGVTFILLSFNEKEKKNRNFIRYMCVCEYINSIKKMFHENNINVRKKVTLKQLMTMSWV
jgi:hypothetical protein